MKIHPVRAELFHMRTDGQTNMTELTVTFRYFSSAPKNYKPFLMFTNRNTFVPHSGHTHARAHTHTHTQEYLLYTQTRCDLWHIFNNFRTGIL